MSLDKVSIAEKDADSSLLPGFSKRDEIYVHREPLQGEVFSTGDLVGYDSDSDLWIVETEGWEYHDLEGNQTDGEVYLHYAEEALNLEVAGYLDPEHRFHGGNFVTGEDLYQVAKHNLEDVDRKLDGKEVQLV